MSTRPSLVPAVASPPPTPQGYSPRQRRETREPERQGLRRHGCCLRLLCWEAGPGLLDTLTQAPPSLGGWTLPLGSVRVNLIGLDRPSDKRPGQAGSQAEPTRLSAAARRKQSRTVPAASPKDQGRGCEGIQQ